MSQIPLSSPDVTQNDIDAVTAVLRTPTLSIGDKIVEFERLCAAVAGRRFGIGVSSGTSGLHLAMMAAGVRAGDEVITTPFSFVASANCAMFVGAKPVFIDIDPKTLNIDVSRVAAAVTSRTRAIVGVEAFGHPGGMIELEQIAQKHELILVEDSCEGFGGAVAVESSAAASRTRPIGSFGRISVFAFYPNKQITTGEGGMIVTDDDRAAALCRSLRNQGRDGGMGWLAHARMGFNFRMSEINAALGVSQVSRLTEIVDARRRVANSYMRRLMSNPHLILPTLDERTRMSWFVFVVRLNDTFECADRDAILIALREKGIGCSNYFPPIHLQPYMREAFGFKPGDFPVCEHVANRTIALPFFNKLTDEQIEHVCTTLEECIRQQLLMGRRKI